MFDVLRTCMASDRLAVRVLSTYGVFLVVFFSVTALSYALLPEGIVRNKNPLQDWDTSADLWLSTIQIFSFNLLSVAAIVAGNLFTRRRNASQAYFPVGYTAFLVLITVNALVLGTWSFSEISEPVPLFDRFVRTFDLANRAGLWEMSGQLLVATATAHIALVISDGNTVITRSWRAIRLSRAELAAMILGLALMATGALVESRAILTLR